MLTATFPSGRKIRAIILARPVNNMWGAVECCHCEWKAMLSSGAENEIANEVREFANNHPCGLRPVKPSEMAGSGRYWKIGRKHYKRDG